MTTLHDQIKLPPLPSPGIHPDEALDMGLESIPYFTADQVRQAQRDAVAQLALASDARIEALEQDNASLREQNSMVDAKCADLEAALQQIADWQSHSSEFSVDYGSNGVRDFYRLIAKQALKGQP